MNEGKLIVDATCTPADIHYPTDLGLLNKAREKTEKIIDTLHAPEIGKQKKSEPIGIEPGKNIFVLQKRERFQKKLSERQ